MTTGDIIRALNQHFANSDLMQLAVNEWRR